MNRVEADDWLERCYYGGLLPLAAERELHLAARAYHDDVKAERHLRQALEIAPKQIVVHLGLYKFYFYKGRWREAIAVAQNCLRMTADELDLSTDWQQVTPGEAAFDRFDDARARFYLFVLKAYGYLQLRLGDYDAGRAVLHKVTELDPQDTIQVRPLLAVFDQKDDSDDE
ncbi:MAG: tetratricopeptide repeat protein [Halothiobacillus sp.]